jgi:hypothetical protein
MNGILITKHGLKTSKQGFRVPAGIDNFLFAIVVLPQFCTSGSFPGTQATSNNAKPFCPPNADGKERWSSECTRNSGITVADFISLHNVK